MTALPAQFLTQPIAHRALHDVTDGRPENSLRAIRAAMTSGYGIEIDIQGSSDAQAMVFHDYDLRRLTPTAGSVHQLSAAALGQIPLCGSPETIPTLAQVLDTVAGQVPILIEVKDQDGAMGPNVGQLEKAIADALRGYRGDVAVMSFNPHSVAFLADVAPAVPRGLVTGSFLPEHWPTLPKATLKKLRGFPDYGLVKACFISHRADDLANPRVAEIRATGTPVLCWTIKNDSAETEARKYADNFTFEGYLPTDTAA